MWMGPKRNGGRLAPTPVGCANAGAPPLFGGGRRRCGEGGHGDLNTPFGAMLELHMAVDQREDGVILPEADIAARLHLGTALADDDVAGDDCFAAELLDAE